MHEAYRYVTIHGDAGQVREAADRLAATGAIVVGAWTGAGGIGWWDDEGMILVSASEGAVDEVAVDLGATGVERLRATARPEAPTALAPGGIFALRWFEIAAEDWDEFLELSTGAWPAFEAAYGATIEGFLRSEPVTEPEARVLLVTRYPSLGAWERSRGALRDPSGDVAEAGRRFLRRRELTKRTVVRTATLL